MSLLFPLRKYRIEFFGNGKLRTWERFAMSKSSATLSAMEAIGREFPEDGKLIHTVECVFRAKEPK